MFCYQCEQADRSGPIPGCSLIRGTCGKDETTSALQDLLIHQLKGLADYAAHARSLGAGDDEAAGFLAFAMFTTLTNVNFSQTRFVELIRQADRLRRYGGRRGHGVLWPGAPLMHHTWIIPAVRGSGCRHA